jgi:hypothetical protein
LEILARGTRKVHFLIFGTVPTIPKSLRTAKMDPAKAEESAGTKLRLQVSFSAQLHQNIKFHWLSGTLDSF